MRRTEIKKIELTKGSSFGSSAIFSKDPPLSVRFLRKTWLYRGLNSFFGFIYLKGL
jgi:hypothetical protein